MRIRALGTVASEISQIEPFRSRGHEPVIALLRTASMVRRQLDPVLRPFRISYEQYNVLRILRGAGADGLAQHEIAKRMIEPTPAMTRLIDKLEAKKLARREICRDDRRRTLVSLTPAGRALLAKLDAPVEQADDACFAMLTNAELAMFVSLMDRIRSKLE